MKVIQAIHLAHVCDQIVVRQHHAFRQTRSAAWIRQHDQVFPRIDIHPRNAAIRFEQRQKRYRAFGFAENEQLLNFWVGRSSSRFIDELGRGD